jgi:hypothetical protein
MPRAETTQLNVRSSFARARAHELAKLTGMTATEVVEDALRGYVPPGAPAGVGRLVQRGAILVIPKSGPIVTLDEANAALDAVREREV